MFLFLRLLILLSLLTALLAAAQTPLGSSRNGGDFSTNLHPTEKQKVPAGVIIVKGAWSNASDTTTPLPDGSTVANNILSNGYFGISYPLPSNWGQKHAGPPPSNTGLYRLGLITPTEAYKGPRGSIAITAEDMFFTPLPANTTLELVNYKTEHLPVDYKMELEPSETRLGGRPFRFYAYWSPVAELHWYVLATEIRCHTVQFVLTSRDTKLLETLVHELTNIKLPAEAGPTGGNGGGEFPECIKDYATEEHVIERVDPVFTERRSNPVPVRIIIDKEGKIKHIHLISAFPDQAKTVTDALKQWRFRPYLRDGKPVEVETGIMFGRAPARIGAPANRAGNTD